MKLNAAYITTLLLAAKLGAEPIAWPDKSWPSAEPAEVGMDAALVGKARDYALTAGGSGMITRHGKKVIDWGDQNRRYDLKSTTKSIGVTALGLALLDKKVKLDDLAQQYHPSIGSEPDSNQKSGWLGTITLKHLATQTAGFDKPGGYTKLLFEPGKKWDYSDSGPNYLAECLTLIYERDMDELMFERVFTPIGITRQDLSWRGNSYRPKDINGVARREFGSGISADVGAMARIGLLYLRDGKWRDEVIIPKSFVDAARTTVRGVVGLAELDGKDHGNASDHYGLLWWNNADGTLKNVPRDAYWSWGLYDSLIFIVPSLDIVATRTGKSWERNKGAGHYEVLAPFFEAIVKSVQPSASTESASLIERIEWSPAKTIRRAARGGDNWPITWADDGQLYTAYGDGRGFEPLVEKKLSLGLATVTGGADDFTGTNLRSASAEKRGDGKSGGKASGLLMVDGVLNMLVRNTGNSQLAWSRDHGKSWQWADWKFTESFGAPTFLNFGKDYAGARDGFVYIYSFDSDSAYQPSDRMVLARVPKAEIAERRAYEFFVRLDGERPIWTSEIGERGAVFSDRGECYRSGVSYNAGIRRFLWAQVKGGTDTRFKGGLGIYEAENPWGPWSNVYHTKNWDVGPGESASFPTKWMSSDGRTVHLVFSGDDAFSVRRATLHLRE